MLSADSSEKQKPKPETPDNMGRPRKHPLPPAKGEIKQPKPSAEKTQPSVEKTIPPQPPMSDAEGEKTPAYLEWLKEHKPDEYAEKMKRWGRTIQ